MHVGSFARSADGASRLPFGVSGTRSLGMPRRVRPWHAVIVGASVAAAALATGMLWPWPWHLQLLAPLLAGAAGWWLAHRRDGDPATVTWGLLLLFSGASAAQRQDAGPTMVVPLALLGMLIGVAITRIGPDVAGGGR